MLQRNKNIILIGYSGHAFVLADIFIRTGHTISGYLDNEAKSLNPYGLSYLGSEKDVLSGSVMEECPFFVAIGDNHIRRKVFEQLHVKYKTTNAIHPQSVTSAVITIGTGVAIMAGAVINPLANIGNGAIINSGAIIEHECVISKFAHIAPGAILAGNVSIGENTFIGTGAAVKQGLKIGKNVTVGAGAVVLKDIPDNVTVYGNPGRVIK